METNERSTSIIMESAVIITIVSCTLYLWGYSFESVSTPSQGIPTNMMPSKSIQDYLLLGGYFALFFLTPFVLLIILIFMITDFLLKSIFDYEIRSKISDIYMHMVKIKSPIRWFLVIIIFYLSTMMINTASARYLAIRGHNIYPKVKTITLDPDAKIKTKYEGLYFITKKDSNYVLCDLDDKRPISYILSEDVVKELVLEMPIIN